MPSESDVCMPTCMYVCVMLQVLGEYASWGLGESRATFNISEISFLLAHSLHRITSTAPTLI